MTTVDIESAVQHMLDQWEAQGLCRPVEDPAILARAAAVIRSWRMRTEQGRAA